MPAKVAIRAKMVKAIVATQKKIQALILAEVASKDQVGNKVGKADRNLVSQVSKKKREKTLASLAQANQIQVLVPKKVKAIVATQKKIQALILAEAQKAAVAAQSKGQVATETLKVAIKNRAINNRVVSLVISQAIKSLAIQNQASQAQSHKIQIAQVATQIAAIRAKMVKAIVATQKKIQALILAEAQKAAVAAINNQAIKNRVSHLALSRQQR